MTDIEIYNAQIGIVGPYKLERCENVAGKPPLYRPTGPALIDEAWTDNPTTAIRRARVYNNIWFASADKAHAGHERTVWEKERVGLAIECMSLRQLLLELERTQHKASNSSTGSSEHQDAIDRIDALKARMEKISQPQRA